MFSIFKKKPKEYYIQDEQQIQPQIQQERIVENPEYVLLDNLIKMCRTKGNYECVVLANELKTKIKKGIEFTS